MRALLVGGTSSGLVAYASWLESWGFSVARFGAMEEALVWFRDGGEADLALVDLDLGVGFADLRKHFLQRSPAGNWIAFAFKPPVGVKDRILLKPLLPLSLLEHLLTSFSNPEVSEKSAIAPNVSKEPEKTLSEGRRPEVLVADDDAVNLRVIRSYLENLGCRVTLARDGFEVLELVKHRSFDALFLDVMMPRKDGTEVLREIRTEERLTSGKHMLVIAVTARAAPSDRKAGIEAGFDEYITKPLSAARIREALQKFGLIAISDAVAPTENPQWGDEDAVVLDLTRLQQLASGNVANMAEIVALYFERVVELFPKLQSAIERRESHESYRLAHTLAGSSATAGMGLAAMAFKRVEAASKANEFSLAASEVAAIPHTIARSAEVAARKLPLKKPLPRL